MKKYLSYSSIMVVVISAIVYMDLANYYSVVSGVAAAPKYIYIVIFFASIPLFLLNRNNFFAYIRSDFSIWCGFFILINVLHLLYNLLLGSGAAVGLTITRIETVIFALLIGFIFTIVDYKLLAVVMVIIAIVLTVLQIIDFFEPWYFVPVGTEGVVVGRSSSTLVNANKAAEVLLLLLIIGMGVLQPVWRVWLFLFVFPGVFLTFSRSGIIIWIVLVIYAAYSKILSRRAFWAIVISMFFLVYFTYEFIFGSVLSSVDVASVENITDRILFFSSFDASDDSARERLTVSRYALDSFYENPLIGNGAGYTYLWSISDQAPHNQYLLMLSEYGVIGILIWTSLILLIYRGRSFFQNLGMVSGEKLFLIFVVSISFFTHNIFDNIYWLLTFSYITQRYKSIW